jgi:hypothetical protein
MTVLGKIAEHGGIHAAGQGRGGDARSQGNPADAVMPSFDSVRTPRSRLSR